jgi:hypothetical protein
VSDIEIAFSKHAVERYAARVKDGLSPAAAEAELVALLPGARIETAPPEWVHQLEPADAYLYLSADLVAPLVARSGRTVAVTLLVRGAISEHERAWRSRKKRHVRQGRNVPKAARRGGRPRTAPQEDW